MLRDRCRLWNAQPKYNRHQPVEAQRPKRKTRAPAGNNAFELTVSVNLPLQDQGDFQTQESEVLELSEDPNIEKQNSALDLVLMSDLNPFPSPRPSRTSDTPREDCHLQMTLKEVAGYIDRIVEMDS